MKKIVLILVVAVLGSISVAFASAPGPKESQIAKLRKEVYEQVKYPTIASENFIEGEVWLTFKVGEKGEIIVMESNSLERQLEKGLRKQLKKIKVSTEFYDADEVYLIKFDFELK